ncbi:hypothetical protein CDAR_183761 [Caerostris darwini]|uniref:Uncharacterized protein n=1 Tax=Caerostris darwini TaxID=1538125 RepID=A0AAV4TY11_9ARAC|nr:hypothetical protein CDAR_183761 [Caerostris darwini]
MRFCPATWTFFPSHFSNSAERAGDGSLLSSAHSPGIVACGQSALGHGCPGISLSLAEGNCEISNRQDDRWLADMTAVSGIHLITDTSLPPPPPFHLFEHFSVGTAPAPPKTDIPPT